MAISKDLRADPAYRLLIDLAQATGDIDLAKGMNHLGYNSRLDKKFAIYDDTSAAGRAAFHTLGLPREGITVRQAMVRAQAYAASRDGRAYRKFAEALDRYLGVAEGSTPMDVADAAPDSAAPGFLVTHNPAIWQIPDEEYDEWIEATADGRLVEGRWATGGRTQGIEPGDRAFLLRQGSEPRGIVAAGRFNSEIFQAPHWRYENEEANYADILWDTVVDFDAPLPLQQLEQDLSAQHWRPQGSGIAIFPDVLPELERLWRDHSGSREAETVHHARSRRQGRQVDAHLRRQIEDLAQDRLMELFRDQGFEVEDTRFGNSFDAVASRGDEFYYLEAKGTIGRGDSVIVTRGEVAWARTHPDQCVMGILSGIEVGENGQMIPDSGVLRVRAWEPDDGLLEPRDYDWTPGEDLDGGGTADDPAP